MSSTRSRELRLNAMLVSGGGAMQKGRAVDYRPMGERRFLERVRRVLIDAVVAGASQILDVRGDVVNIRRYKANRELVTLADERSDAAMTAVFAERLARVAPGVGWHLEESGRRHAVDAAAWVGGDPLDGTQPFASGGTRYLRASALSRRWSAARRRDLPARSSPSAGRPFRRDRPTGLGDPRRRRVRAAFDLSPSVVHARQVAGDCGPAAPAAPRADRLRVDRREDDAR